LNSFLVNSRTTLQRFLNQDGTLKEKGPVTIDGTEVFAVDILLPPKPEDDETLEKRLVDTGKLVDTTLFRGYMLAQPSMAGPLFRLPNHCDTNVVKDKLLESKRYNDIIDFFFGKRLHKEALSLLHKLAKDEGQEELPVSLQGPERTVAYLQSLPPDYLDLILEYAKWPLEDAPDIGMEVFLADTENAESLPRDKVLAFLREIDSKLAAKYLEHIIHELNDTSAEFHKQLIEEYLKSLKNSDEKKVHQEKLVGFLKASKHYQSWKILPLLQRNGKLL
jgi:Vam6/Vps39-like protein vacuolar protein sorting-associated protein 39